MQGQNMHLKQSWQTHEERDTNRSMKTKIHEAMPTRITRQPTFLLNDKTAYFYIKGKLQTCTNLHIRMTKHDECDFGSKRSTLGFLLINSNDIH